MPAKYSIRIRDRAGAKLEEFDNFLDLSYTKVVNDAGLLKLSIPNDSEITSAFEKDGQIEVWREDIPNEIEPYIDFYGLFRAREVRRPDSSKRGVFTALCPGLNHFLGRSIVAYPANTPNRSVFTSQPAETVLKALATYNATVAGSTSDTPTGRIRNVGGWGNYITVQANAAAGSTLSIAVAHRNLLETMQEVAQVGGLEFNVVKTGAQAFQYVVYANDAYDLTADVKFSTEWDNMGNPVLTGTEMQERTIAIIAGTGQNDSRTFRIRAGANWAAGYNDSEVFVNYPQQGIDADALDAVGDARLAQVRSKEDVNFKVMQTEADRYGRDYCVEGRMGELVTVNFEVSVVKKIRSVTVVLANNNALEDISMEMVTV